jgi:hypothetical protein
MMRRVNFVKCYPWTSGCHYRNIDEINPICGSGGVGGGGGGKPVVILAM